MTTTDRTNDLHDYVSELLDATRKIIKIVADKDHETVDTNAIIDYYKSVNAIHSALSKSYDPSEGRSKVIERLLNQWNNILLGVFYTAGVAEKNKRLTKKQFDIFVDTLAEAIQYGKKHHHR